MPAPVNGTLEVRVAGETVLIRGKIAYAPGGKRRKAQVGPTGVVGFEAEHYVPYIELEAFDHRGLDLLAISAIFGETATVRLDNGKTAAFGGVCAAGEFDVDGAVGQVNMRFEAEWMTESLA